MPANNQPGTDWPAIRTRLEAGESARAISDSLRADGSGPSHTAILKRARKEGWFTETNGPVVAGMLVSKAVDELPTSRRVADPQTRGDKILASLGKRSPETAKAIIERVRAGVSPSVAAQAAGISPATLSVWRHDDPQFDELIKAARHELLADMQSEMPNAAKRGDWKAADRVLQVAPETRDEYRQSAAQQGGITVIINTGAQQQQPDPVIIDVTPA